MTHNTIQPWRGLPAQTTPVILFLSVCIAAPVLQATPAAAREEIPADPDDPDQVYEIERILSAKKEGGRFMILVKWTGYPDATYVPRKQLLEDCGDPEIVKQVEDAVERYRLSNLRLAVDGELSTEDEQPVGDQPAVEAALGRGRRERRAVMRYAPTNFVEYWNELDSMMMYITEYAAQAAS